MFTGVYNSVEEMDTAINQLCDKLVKSNPEAMMLLKKVMWRGTENWDTLLSERAEMSGKLVLSEFTRNAIQQFKQKAK
jgi:methylglutaconyl-CoA hydratase